MHSANSVNPIETNYGKHAPVDQHNNEHLQCLRALLHRLKVTDQYPPKEKDL